MTKYIEGISPVYGNCTTPMTIAFQGNRVSGGNSLLKMLFDRLRPSYGNNLLWLNARQLPQGCSGEEQTVPVQATVIIFGFSPCLLQLTITAGSGYSILPGFHTCLPISSSVLIWPAAPVNTRAGRTRTPSE